jgi:hypothetical protein
MKKFLLFISLLGLHISNAQDVGISQDIGITQVNLSQISDNEINVNLKVITNASTFISSSYTINGNDIELKACYYTKSIAMMAALENDIPITIPADGNYNLNIVIYQSTEFEVCDYNNIQHSATLNFSAPLSETITLSSHNFSNTDTANLYPNPTDGVFHISDNVKGSSISIYDELGRKVKNINHVNEDGIDIREFENGMYLVEIQNSKTKMVRKLILKK